MVEKVLQINNKEKTIFWSLIAVLVLCCGFYMYCVNATVHNTITRQNLEAEASALTLEIGRQEFQYISKRNAVTLALAHSLGFKDTTPTSFVSKKSNGSEVSFLSR